MKYKELFLVIVIIFVIFSFSKYNESNNKCDVDLIYYISNIKNDELVHTILYNKTKFKKICNITFSFSPKNNKEFELKKHTLEKMEVCIRIAIKILEQRRDILKKKLTGQIKKRTI